MDEVITGLSFHINVLCNSPAALAFFNVFIVRGEESETGIQVFDSHGNLVGISKAAGEKVKEEQIEEKLFTLAVCIIGLFFYSFLRL